MRPEYTPTPPAARAEPELPRPLSAHERAQICANVYRDGRHYKAGHAYDHREWCNRRGYLTGEKPPRESPVPPVKVYVQHFNEAQIAAFNAALRQQHDPA